MADDVNILDDLGVATTPVDQQETEINNQPSTQNINNVDQEIFDIITQASTEGGIDPSTMLAMAEIESNFNPQAQNKNSSAGGLFQFLDSTGASYGVTDKTDPVQSSVGAVQLANDNIKTVTRSLMNRGFSEGEARDLASSAGGVYLAHQQGASGAARLITGEGVDNKVIQNNYSSAIFDKPLDHYLNNPQDFAADWMQKANNTAAKYRTNPDPDVEDAILAELGSAQDNAIGNEVIDYYEAGNSESMAEDYDSIVTDANAQISVEDILSSPEVSILSDLGEQLLPETNTQVYNRALASFGTNGAVRATSEFDTENAFEYGIDAFQNTMGEGIAGIGDFFGFQNLSDYGRSVVQQQEEDIANGGFQRKYDGSFLDQDGWNKMGWLWENALIQTPNIALTFVPFGAGASAARWGMKGVSSGLKAAGKQAISPATMSKVSTMSGVASSTAAGTALGTGSMIEELKEKGVYDEDAVATAIGFGVVSGALNSLLPALISKGAGSTAANAVLGKFGMMKNVPEQAYKGIGTELLSGSYVASQAAKGIASSALVEGSTEFMEEALQIGLAEMQGAQYADGEVGARLMDSFILGGALGGSISGGVSGSKYLYQTAKGKKTVSGDAFTSTIETNDPDERAAIRQRADIADGEFFNDFNQSFDNFAEKNGNAAPDNYVLGSNEGILQKDEDIVDFVKLAATLSKEASDGKINRDRLAESYGAKDYDTFKTKTFNTAKTEISEIFSDRAMDFDIQASDARYSNLDQMADDVRNYNVMVPEDRFTNSELNETIQGDLTYGQALEAISMIYGDTLGKNDGSITGQLNSIRKVASMFSQDAKPAVVSELITRKFSHLFSNDNIDNMSVHHQLSVNYDNAIQNNSIDAVEIGELLDKTRSNIEFFDTESYKSDLLPPEVIDSMVDLVANYNSDAETISTTGKKDIENVFNIYTGIDPSLLERDSTIQVSEDNALLQKYVGTQERLSIHASNSLTSINRKIEEIKKEDIRANSRQQEAISELNITESKKQLQESQTKGSIFQQGLGEGAQEVGNKITKDMSPRIRKMMSYSSNNILNVKDSQLEAMQVAARGEKSFAGKKAVNFNFLLNDYIKESKSNAKKTKKYQKATEEEQKAILTEVDDTVNKHIRHIFLGEMVPQLKDFDQGFTNSNIEKRGDKYVYVSLIDNSYVLVDETVSQLGADAARMRAGFQDTIIGFAMKEANGIQKDVDRLNSDIEVATTAMAADYPNGVIGWLESNGTNQLKAYNRRGGSTLPDKIQDNIEDQFTNTEALEGAILDHFASEGDGEYIYDNMMSRVKEVAEQTAKITPKESGIQKNFLIDSQVNSITGKIINALETSAGQPNDQSKYKSFKEALSPLFGDTLGVEFDFLLGAYKQKDRVEVSQLIGESKVKSGELQQKQDFMQEIVGSDNGLGGYIHRVYEAHHNVEFANSMREAKDKILSEEEFDTLETKVKNKKKLDNESDAFAYRYNKAINDKTDYVLEEQRKVAAALKDIKINDSSAEYASFIPKGTSIKEVMSDHNSSVVASHESSLSYTELLQQTDSFDIINNIAGSIAKGQVDSIVDNASAKFDEGFGGMSYSDSVVRKRVKMEDADRAMLGEFTDIKDQVKNTLVSLSNYVADKRVYGFIHDNYINPDIKVEDKFVLTEADRNKMLNSGDEALINRAESMNPVNFSFLEKYGMDPSKVYASDAVKNAMSSLDNFMSDGLFMKGMQGLTAEFKYFTTIMNPTQWAANLASNVPSLIMNGNYVNWAQGSAVQKESNPAAYLRDVYNFVRNGDVKNEQWMDAIKRMGLNQSDAELIVAFKKNMVTFKAMDHIASMASNTKAGTIANKANDAVSSYQKFSEDMYAGLGDISSTMAAYFFNEKMLVDKFGKSFDHNYLKDTAAEITTLTMPNFSQLPKAAKDITTRLPVGGTFLSFHFLAYSTVANQFKVIRRMQELGALDYAVKKDPNFDVNAEIERQEATRGGTSLVNPASYTPAMKEYLADPQSDKSAVAIKTGGVIAGAGLYSGVMTSVVSAVVGALGGEEVDELNLPENKSVIREMLPEYYRNMDFVVQSVNDDGSFKIMNLSRLNNFAPLKDIYTILDNEHMNSLEKAQAVMGSMSGGIEQQNFGYQFINKILSGEDEFGRPIFDEGDGVIEMAGKSVEEFFTSIATNSFIKEASDLALSLSMDEQMYDKHGYNVDARDMMLGLSGFRVIDVDPTQSMSFKMSEIKQSINRSRRDITSKLKTGTSKFNQMNDGNLSGALNQARNIHYEKHEEALKKIKILREFGNTDTEILGIMSGSGKFSKDDSRSLLRGRVPSFDVSRVGDTAIESLQGRSIPNEAKENMINNFDRLKELNEDMPVYYQDDIYQFPPR